MPTVKDLVDAIELIAPPRLAQAWDNVGLIAGEPDIRLRRCLLCIDFMPPVAAEAIRRKCQAVIAYHPPIFKPVKSLRTGTGTGGGPMDALYRAIRAGIAVYSPHTALDAAEGGTGDALAGLLGARIIGPISPDRVGTDETKVVVFVPAAQVERVCGAMFAAGAGRIGLYEECSFRLAGTGTFFGGEGTNPRVGSRGRLEAVEELRVEMVCGSRHLSSVISALRETHPYEEPAFDLYPLSPKPAESRGIGRLAELPKPMALGTVASQLARAVKVKAAQVVGDMRRPVRTLAILVGAAGRIDIEFPRSQKADVLITGEIRHHDALAFAGSDWSAIALGHWASERPVLPRLAAVLEQSVEGVQAIVSTADRDPLAIAVA